MSAATYGLWPCSGPRGEEVGRLIGAHLSTTGRVLCGHAYEGPAVTPAGLTLRTQEP
jgi:hypothetical protein